MPIKFVSLSSTFTEKIKQHGYEAFTMKIEEFVPTNQTTVYVSPANSLGFMDGGIDYALSRTVFPGVESQVKSAIRQLGIVSLVGKPYLPIGSSLLLKPQPKQTRDSDVWLCVAPTMMLPQDVRGTKNAYYATMAILKNISSFFGSLGSQFETVDILFTSFCCGYGKMSEEESIQQILDGIRDFKQYIPTRVDSTRGIVLHEANLFEQPKLYQNTEFFHISPSEIQRC
ncbi:MAG: hypothetical protein EBX50_22260 [Chitinophagia bacterium]|nr:hypothetical protein [Chitinophagia bacterium]